MSLYKKSGVDVEKADRLASLITSRFPEIGGYAGTFEAGGVKFAATCDGVGTKLKIAQALGKHRGVGVDLVAMSVNDLIAAGARPLFFLDYFACGRLDQDIFKEVLEGIEEGLKISGCALLGGETAELPGMLGNADYDLAGFAVGLKVSEPGKGRVERGDVIVGWSSSGLHSNGFSLVRKLFAPDELAENTRLFLEPTRIYRKLVPDGRNGLDKKLKNLAHVTGGGIKRALKRLLPDNIDAEIYDYEFPEVFKMILERGVSREEMLAVFNCGLGMIAAVSPEDAEGVAELTGGSIVGKTG